MALDWLWWGAWVSVDAVDAVAFGMAGVALGDMDHFAWHAWHLVTWIVTLRGRRGTNGIGLALVARLGRRGFWRGRLGTWWHGPSLCPAGVALGDMDRHFAWQAWHLWHWAGSGGALGSQLTPWTPRLLAWQAWHLATSSVDSAWQVRHLATCTCILRGRCGTWRHRASILRGRRGTYGTGLALVACLGPSWRRGCRGCLRRSRGTWWHGLALCVAGVALGDVDRHFAWQAWHLWHWAGSGGTGLALVARLRPSWRRGRRGFSRGWRDTWRHGLALCVAGVALGDMDRHFAWQAWHLWHWAGSGEALGSQLTPWTRRLLAWQAWHLATSSVDSAWQVRHLATCTCILRGRCGTWRHRASILRGRRGTYGTGLALVACLGPSWRRGRRGCLPGRRGTWWHGLALCVAGVALGDVDRHFAWQARLGPSWRRGRRGFWRGRRGTWRHPASILRGRCGTWRHVRAFCVAGVALGDMDRHFAWQAWHLWHWAGSGGALGRRGRRGCLRGRRGTWRHRASILCGRRGTWRHVRAFCVARVDLSFVSRPYVSLAGTSAVAVALLHTQWHVTVWMRFWYLRHLYSYLTACSQTTMTPFLGFAALRIAGMYLCCGICTFAHAVTCLCSDEMLIPASSVAIWQHAVRQQWHVSLLSRHYVLLAGTSAPSLALLHTLWHVCVGWDLTACSQTAITRFLGFAALRIAGRYLFIVFVVPQFLGSFSLIGRSKCAMLCRDICCAQTVVVPLAFLHTLFTHNLLTRTLSSPTCSHQFVHTQLAHTHLVLTNLSSHNLLTHTLSSPTCSHQFVHTQLAHTHLVLTNLSSHNLLTHNLSSHILSSHILSSLAPTQLVLTQLVHTQLVMENNALVRRSSAWTRPCDDRSEQFLCNRLPLFLCCLLSAGATLLHLPQSLGRSSMLRCRDLC